MALDPTNLINTDPLLGPLADNGGPTQTMALLPGSPAINAGVAVPGVTTDQRGVTRPQGNATDIGAFESRGFILAVVSGDDQSTETGTAFPAPLVVSVVSPFGEPVAGGLVTFTAPVTGAAAEIVGTPDHRQQRSGQCHGFGECLRRQVFSYRWDCRRWHRRVLVD